MASVTEYYLATTAASGVTTSTSGWTTAVQTITTEKKYLWNYEVIAYSDGSTPTTTAPAIIGVYGDKGAQGNPGKGIASITEYYLATDLDSDVYTTTAGWTTAVQTIDAENPYLWNYEVVTYTDNTTTTTTPVIIGTYGRDGKDGDTGARGPVLRGPQNWDDVPNLTTFQSGAAGEQWLAVVICDGQYYICKTSHQKSALNRPSSSLSANMWQLSDKIDMVATKLLLAQYALVENLGVTAVEMKDASGNVVFSAKDGNVTCDTGTFNNVAVESGKIAGFNIEGMGLTNEGLDNDAYVIIRNDSANVFAGIGANVLPDSSGIRALGRFDNLELNNTAGTNYALALSVKNARHHVAIDIDGGCIQGLAMKNHVINSSGSNYLDRSVSNVLVLGSELTNVYLPTMQLWDDGHVIRIKSLNTKSDGVRIYAQNCHTFNGTYTRTAKPVIIYNRADYIYGSDYLSIGAPGDAMEFVWVRDITTTISGTIYYGAWVQYKLPRDW